VTRVDCTLHVIAAIQCRSRHTRTILAQVAVSADVGIVASGIVVIVLAALQRVAGIIGADLLVIAHKGLPPQAFTLVASLTLGALVAVVTRLDIVRVDASLTRQAGIVSAEV